MIKVALAGFGFMGATHADCYREIPGADIVGIADANPGEAGARAAAKGLAVPVESTLERLLERVEMDAVDICLPTDLHRSVAETAFRAGKHVFCEKPMALTLEDGAAMVEGARKAGVQLMVGHCLRFWPEYLELERRVRAGESGKLLWLSMSRFSGRPASTVENWVSDPARCTGAVLDLHIHDTDFIRHLLGAPLAVSARGIELKTGWDFISTHYHYDDLAVHAEGGWHLPSRWGFRMSYLAVFETGALEYNSQVSPTLRWTPQAGETEPVPVEGEDALTAYRAELAYFIDCLAHRQPVTINTGAEAAESLRIILAEIESVRQAAPFLYKTI